MDIKKLLIAVFGVALAVPAMAAENQPSAKFAAVWTDGATVVRSDADCDTETEMFCEDLGSTDVGITIANIKVPQNKELLVGVSAQIELFTETVVRGKKGSESRSLAAAAGGVVLEACNWDTNACTTAAPGYITLNSREQELSAILGGIIETCTFDVQLEVIDDVASGDATWDLDDCEVEQEEIALALTTMSAHHFNFVLPNMESGNYSIVATFDTSADAVAEELACPDTSDYCSAGDGDASAISHAIIGKTMVTIQEVRAVNGSLDVVDFSDL